MVEQSGLQKYIAPHRKLLQEGFFGVRATPLPESKVSVAIQRAWGPERTTTTDTLTESFLLQDSGKASSVDVAMYLFNDLLVMFFSKAVKLKDARRLDFTELAWPTAIMWANPDTGKGGGLRAVGPGYALVVGASSKDKDGSVANSQLAGFLAKLSDVLAESANRTNKESKYPRPAQPTQGCKHGDYVFPEGHTYYGEWREGVFAGQGVLEYPGGLRVEGNFHDGEKDGKCRIVYPTGEVYEGNCVKGVQHGVGMITWPNGDNYQGYWLDGRRDGEGSFTCVFYKYVGTWRDGFMEGDGRLEFNGGGSYQGKFMLGKFHGDGLLSRASGIITKGTSCHMLLFAGLFC